MPLGKGDVRFVVNQNSTVSLHAAAWPKLEEQVADTLELMHQACNTQSNNLVYAMLLTAAGPTPDQT